MDCDWCGSSGSCECGGSSNHERQGGGFRGGYGAVKEGWDDSKGSKSKNVDKGWEVDSDDDEESRGDGRRGRGGRGSERGGSYGRGSERGGSYGRGNERGGRGSYGRGNERGGRGSYGRGNERGSYGRESHGEGGYGRREYDGMDTYERRGDGRREDDGRKGRGGYGRREGGDYERRNDEGRESFGGRGSYGERGSEGEGGSYERRNERGRRGGRGNYGEGRGGGGERREEYRGRGYRGREDEEGSGRRGERSWSGRREERNDDESEGECLICKMTGHIYRNCPNNPEEARKAREYIPLEEEEEELFKSKLEIGDNFENYRNVQVKVTPEQGCPNPIGSFRELDLPRFLEENIISSGYKVPTPVQRHGIPIIFNSKDVMACAQTGSGKTAAFLIPIISTLHEEDEDVPFLRRATPSVLIMAPTRELVSQIKNEARKFCHRSKIHCRAVYGGVSLRHHESSLKSERTDILVATPGRLEDLIDRSLITFERLKFLVIDEADRMLDMGFFSAVENIVGHSSMPEKDDRQTLLFSATLPKEVQELAFDFLHDYFFLRVGIVGGACEDIEQVIFKVSHEEKLARLISIVGSLGDLHKKVIIFARRKKMVDFLATRLCLEKFPSTSIHGDRLQFQRDSALRDFKKGVMPILVATEVAARGLDIPEVAYIVNYDLPQEISTYVHRIGRSGRIGNRGKAISFYDEVDDKPLTKSLVTILKGAKQHVPDWLMMACDDYGDRKTNESPSLSKDIRDFGNGADMSNPGDESNFDD